MPPADRLQRLRNLDRSSPGFPHQLIDILLEEDWVNWVQDLPPDEVGEPVECLDNALNSLNPTSLSFYRCLCELQRICGAREVLPTSHILQHPPSSVSDRPIASGPLADVHRGTLAGSAVYVKRVRVYSNDNPGRAKILFHEAAVWKRLVHPNIVPFCGVSLNPPQLVSDWMVSGDLMGFITEHPNANRLGLLNDIAEGLDYLHSRNVVHGSITGRNVLVDRLGRACLTEFALTAVGQNECSPYEIREMRKHNSRWAAPELLDGKGPLTKKADVFSFAMVMVEVFTGAVPFSGLWSVASTVKIITGERPPRPDGAAISDDVWNLMQMCWCQHPQSRPEMRGVLRHLAPSLLQSLHRPDKSLPEFSAALSQFYDSTERERFVNRLRGVELREFVNFLDEVLRIERLSKELLRSTQQALQGVCAKWAILRSLVTPSHTTGLTAEHYAPDGCAGLWRGQVCLGEEGNDTTDVCVKAVRAEKVHDEFHAVVARWAKLDHPNILRCFGVTDNPLQIVTDWMPNGQAIQYVQNRQDAERVRLLVGVACGLDYLHSQGLIHGNLEQQNILVDSAGEARLSNVGFAKLVPADESGFDWADVGVGGCRWAAPEVFLDGKLSKQTDVFSCGFVAAEIFTGGLIWEGAMETNSRILGGERPRIPEDRKTCALTQEVWRVFTKCWEKVPDRRLSISEVLNLLQYLPQRLSGVSSILERATTLALGQGQEQIDELDKILETNMIKPGERARVLNILCKMCYRQSSLPKSMVITCPLDIPAIAYTGGGCADVYQTEYDGRPVAVKSIRIRGRSGQERCSSRLCREAIIWRHLRHPNVLPLLGAALNMQTPRFALLSEWMDNGTINEFVKKHGEVNRAQLLVDVAHGLEYIHCLNFAHGDLKGENILINKYHHACLTDFGFSTVVRVAPNSMDISPSTAIHNASVESLVPHCSGGTTSWMSPELLHPRMFGLDDDRPTTQSDCYALGMVVYEVLCGKPPYQDYVGNLLQAILDDVRPSKPDAAATLGFTDELWWVVECCWMTDRETRPDVKTVLSQLTHAAWAWDRRL